MPIYVSLTGFNWLVHIAGSRVIFSAGDAVNDEIKRRTEGKEGSFTSIYVNVGAALSGEDTDPQSGIPMVFTSPGNDLYLFSLVGLKTMPLQMTEIVNTGQFNMNSSIFVASMDGIYYFSVSNGLQPNIIVELMLKVNGVDVYIIFHRSTHHIGVSTISDTTLLDLKAGDKVSLHLTMGRIHSSIEQHEMSFVGFLYSPRFATGVAWAVSLTNTITCTSQNSIIYDKVDVIKGFYVDNFGNMEVPVSGTYYIYCSVFGSVNSITYIRLMVNGWELMVVPIASYDSSLDGLVAASGSLIYTFRRGDKLSVHPDWTNMDIMGDTKRSTSFMGFLIKETK